MKKQLQTALLCLGFFPALATAQEVDLEKYTDYEPYFNPNPELMVPVTKMGRANNSLPDHVNNAENKYLPPRFNQSGGSCGSASRICYMFTYEMAAYRDVDASLLSNRYPSHFTWLLTKGNSGKEDIIQHVGVPNAETYGGTTYSTLFGPQDYKNGNFGWMQGYEKWYAAMFNRMLAPENYPVNLQSEEGRTALKHWIWNHNGDTDFHAGGVAGVGVGIRGSELGNIPATTKNNANLVSNLKYMKHWGTQTDHAVTIVGYDDRIEFDLNGDGKVGDPNADEVGAWIVVNSWGPKWANEGCVYVPYAYSGKTNDLTDPNHPVTNSWWYPEVYKVRKNYRPLRTLKIKMDYSHRSEIALSMGVASDLNATAPEKTVPLYHFNYSGDGKEGTTNPTPEIPMLGLWADGTLHTEPMEFGYDLTDLTDGFDRTQPLKYFLMVDARSWAAGQGKIYNASVIDYEFDEQGAETPFEIATPIDVRTPSGQTKIATVVYGENYGGSHNTDDSFNAPMNASCNNGVLTWNAPAKSSHPLTGYQIFADGTLLKEVAASVTSYTLGNGEKNHSAYAVAAVYENNQLSEQVAVDLPLAFQNPNISLSFQESGFSIPNVFDKKYNEATIEYWLNPTDLSHTNSVGPGFKAFSIFNNARGKIITGWAENRKEPNNKKVDLSTNRVTSKNSLKGNQWNHIAVTIKGNTMTLYLNGKSEGSFSSADYSGIGGFGNLDFYQKVAKDALNAQIDEVRIWDYARSAEEIQNCMNAQFSGAGVSSHLLAYLNCDTFEENGTTYLKDAAKGHHAPVIGTSNESIGSLKLGAPTGTPTVSINAPQQTIYMGQPVKFTANCSETVAQLTWTATGTAQSSTQHLTPSFIFNKVGQQTVTVTAAEANHGKTATASCKVMVEAQAQASADFKMYPVPALINSTVTFHPIQPMPGYSYAWKMPGALKESSNNMNATAIYPLSGSYEVTLTVTAPGQEPATMTKTVEVIKTAPVADFDITPAILLKGETTTFKDLSKNIPTSWRWHVTNQNHYEILKGKTTNYVPQSPGVYDVMLKVGNEAGTDEKSRRRALIVCNADSKNGLTFGSEKKQVQLTSNPLNGLSQYTVEFWLNPYTMSPMHCGIGEDNTLSLYADKTGKWHFCIQKDASHKDEVKSAEIIRPNEWHHYAVTFNNNKVSFFLDGKYQSSGSLGGKTKVPNIGTFCMSTAAAPFDGQIDEFRIWNKALDEAQILSRANAPIADIAQAKKEGLLLYYDFNQSDGDVIDRAGNNTGKRLNFGPAGDAWALSEGVFCLNEETQPMTDVSATYLKNYQAPFHHTGQNFISGQNHAKGLTDWTLENATDKNGTAVGAHVNTQHGTGFTITTGDWSKEKEGIYGFTNNHKAFQTVSLPAGTYRFEAHVDTKYTQINADNTDNYLVVAANSTLPDNMKTAIAYTCIQKDRTDNAVQFTLTRPTTVSLGIVSHQGYKKRFVIDYFKLSQAPAPKEDADAGEVYQMTVKDGGFYTLHLGYNTTLPEGITAYTAQSVTSTSVQLSEIARAGEVLNSETPVILDVVLPAGQSTATYVFNRTSQSGKTVKNNLLHGTNETMYVAPTAGCIPYVLGVESGEVVMLKAKLNRDGNGNTGNTHFRNRAHKAWLEVPSMNANAHILHFDIENEEHTGVENIIIAEEKRIYDLQGRRLQQPGAPGIYIINGKKVYIK